jgi:hypothetical protein
MADLVDPREGRSKFDDIASSDLGRDPGPEPHPSVEDKPASPRRGEQVDPRKEYREFDGIHSRE